MPPALPLNLKLMSGRVRGIWGAVNTQERQLGDITTDRDKNPLHHRERLEGVLSIGGKFSQAGAVPHATRDKEGRSSVCDSDP